MRSFMLSTPVLVLCMVGCAPDEPAVVLESPTGIGPYYADLPIDVQARISDEEHDLETLTARWTSSLDEGLDGPTEIGDDGAVAGQVQLSAGAHILTLEVEDKGGRVGTAQVALSVAAENSPPTCLIEGPTAQESTAAGAPTSISLRVDDVDIGPQALTLALSSDQDGDLGPVSVDSAGMATVSATLSTGVHTLTWVATDERGAECTARRDHNVVEPPSVTLTGPTDGFVEDIGNAIVFTGQVSDDRDGPADLTVEWTSDRQGGLLTGTAGADGTTVLETPTPSRCEPPTSRGPHPKPASGSWSMARPPRRSLAWPPRCRSPRIPSASTSTKTAPTPRVTPSPIATNGPAMASPSSWKMCWRSLPTSPTATRSGA